LGVLSFFGCFLYTCANQKSITMGIILFLVLIYIAVVVMMIAAQWKVFSKAGQPGWASLIPIYNVYVMTKIAGKPAWWLIMFLIPVVNVIFLIWLINMISKSFGKDEGFTAGLIFLGVIFWPILGFSGAKYQGPYGDPAQFKAFQDQNKFDFEKK
jgi:uncharacterized membrane protein YhaH (DUF805 family)